MAASRPNSVGNARNPKGNPASLVPGAGQKLAAAKAGRFSEETRARLRPLLVAAIKAIEDMLDGNATLTPTEAVNAFKAIAPYVMTELRPVIDKTLCLILAEELSNTPGIDPEIITDITDRMLARLSAE